MLKTATKTLQNSEIYWRLTFIFSTGNLASRCYSPCFYRFYTRQFCCDALIHWATPNPTFICSKWTMEKLEKSVNLFIVNNKNARTATLTSFWYLYCWFWTNLTNCSDFSIVDFEQANAGWVRFNVNQS